MGSRCGHRDEILLHVYSRHSAVKIVWSVGRM
jgi:hypothetical protein